MTKSLYLMRHGETLFNTQKRIQGWCDSPLTELGQDQARQARAYFEEAGLTFDALYCSTAERTADTLELVTGRTDYKRLKGLREWGFGRMEGQPEYLHPTPQPGQIGHGDYYKIHHGGESQEELGQRIKGAVFDIAERTAEGETVLAVSHAGALMNFMFQLDLKAYPLLHISNCIIFHYEVEDGQFHLVELIDPITGQVFPSIYPSLEEVTADFFKNHK
ncbi:histidine phosphatase family protein [Streptococcus caprae]|uniref:Histidine phosphatase family protein n=1 Tax=Streptococcus caprae TaxID=1640501 RepID=A0ABV8CVP3_9STRE